MIQPAEMKLLLPVTLSGEVMSTTHDVWEILMASRNGDIETVKQLVFKCPELIYAQYNYAPPIHFAAREGHADLVTYLLNNGAHDPAYKIYPFQESLENIASQRGHNSIVALLEQYAANPSMHRYKGDNGAINYNRSSVSTEFEQAVDQENLAHVRQLLEQYPHLTQDDTYFWGEGIVMMPAKACNYELVELLLNYGARIPAVIKWGQYYYFENYGMATFLMENGMDANTMSWQHVSLLHDMAQKGDIEKAALLLKYGADINALDEEYCSTALGMAAKWGHFNMVEFLLEAGADPARSAAPWSSPLAWAKRNGHENIEELLLRSSKN